MTTQQPFSPAHPLPATYVRHLIHPIGLGDLEAPHAAGEVGSIVGGLGVRVTLRYAEGDDSNPTVHAFAGRGFGHPSLVAPISFLADQVPGKSWDAAGAWAEAEILDALADGQIDALPPAVHRAVGFVYTALQRALGISTEGPPADCTGPGVLVCRCIGVGDRTVREAIRAGATTPDAIGAATGACTGCRSCRPDLLALLDEERSAAWPAPDASLSTIGQIAWARGGPLLRGLGLPLATVSDADDGGLTITLGAAEPHVLTSALGAVAQLRYVLRETTGKDVPVECVSA